MSLSTTFEQHMQRIRAATTQRLHRRDAARWIEQNTYINGRRFSFKDHEYQERILLEEAPDVVVTKCAQVGISEMSLRLAAALPQIMPGAFRIGYVMPSATAASDYAQARFGPVVRGSPALRSAALSAGLPPLRSVGDAKEEIPAFTQAPSAARSTCGVRRASALMIRW